MQAAEQGVGANTDPQTGGRPCSGFATQGIAYLIEGLRLAAGPAGVGLDQRWKPFGEDGGGAVRPVTEEALQPQLQPDGNAVPGEIGQPACVTTLDAGGRPAAAGAGRIRLAGPCHQRDQRVRGDEILELDEAWGGKQGLQSHTLWLRAVSTAYLLLRRKRMNPLTVESNR
jgi:hypothetical protein